MAAKDVKLTRVRGKDRHYYTAVDKLRCELEAAGEADIEGGKPCPPASRCRSHTEDAAVRLPAALFGVIVTLPPLLAFTRCQGC